MAENKATPERLGAFSDGVLAIIITIMVLDLKVPHESNVHALTAMWPTFFRSLAIVVGVSALYFVPDALTHK